MRKLLLALVTLFIFCYAQSQDFSNKGKDFWLGYGYHVRMDHANGGGDPQNNQKMVLYFTSDQNANVTVEIPSLGYSQSYSVVANQVTTTQELPKNNGQDSRIIDTGYYNTGIHIISDKPVVAYAHIYNQSVSGASLLFPTNTLGQDYYAINYTQKSNEVNAYSYFFVLATEDNTVVEITPSAANRNGKTPGAAFNVSLSKGQIYSVFGTVGSGNTGTDLTGSRIRSISTSIGGCKKIAVFSGSGKISIGGAQTGSADNLFAQNFPSNAWGKNYLTVPTYAQPNNFYRVCVSDPTAIVKLNGNVLTGLVNNFYYEFKNQGVNVSNIAVPNKIESDKPILVAQYCTTQGQEGNPGSPGDPEMIYLSPVEQTINNITLNSTSNYNISDHYINVVIKSGGISSFKLDGNSVASSFATHPQDSKYSYANLSVTAGSHNIYSDTGFNAIAYGFGNAESYGYNAGTNVRDLYQYVSLANEYSTVNFPATCIGTPFKFSITLPYLPTSLTWDFGGNTNLSPNTNVINNSPVADSTFIKDGKTLYVFKLPSNYIFSAAGTNAVKVLVNNPTADGCNGIQEINYDITVYGKPIAKFAVVNSGCVNDSLKFADVSDGGTRPITNWKWFFGDGGIDSIKNPPHKYATVGTGSYNVKLIAITDIGCGKDTTIPVSISAKPTAVYSFGLPACMASNITVNNASTLNTPGSLVKWYWDFGYKKDTVTSGVSQTVNYTNYGSFTTSLIVETNTGCRDTANQTVTVGPYPEVGFVLPEVCLTDISTFVDTSKIVDGTPLSYQWNFNAGTPAITPAPTPATSTSKNGITKFNKADNYTVSLKVTSNNGCATDVSKAFTVNGAIPTSSFTVLNVNNLCSNNLVQIQNTSTVDFGIVTKLIIYWDNGNFPAIADTIENPQPNQIFSHKYPDFQQPSTTILQIKVDAYSGGSCSDPEAKFIILHASPKVQFVAMPGICLEATPRQITQATETGGVAGASTAFTYTGVGVSSTGLFDPAVAGVGTFSIKYLYVSDFGCRDSASEIITVWPSPKAGWYNSSITCEKNDILFTDTSKANFSNIATWNWNFDDGNVTTYTTAVPFNKKYTTAQINPYYVHLKIVTDKGCVDTITKPIKVNYLPVVTFTMPANVCLPDGRATFNSTSTITDNTEALFGYLWNFNDPNDATNALVKSPTHKYSSLPSAGFYNIKLRVTSNAGCIDSLTQQFTNIRPQPTAIATATPVIVCVGDNVNFKDVSGIANNNWKWNFKDGDTSILQNVSHQFNTVGLFNAEFYMYDANNCISNVDTTTIKVNALPTLDAGGEWVVLQGGTVQINTVYTAVDPIFKWESLSTGSFAGLYLSSDTAARPFSKPPDDIMYKVTLTSEGGCSISAETKVTVLKNPVIPNAFTPNGDGINDKWIIQYLNSYPGATIEVYNRGGQLVFNSIGYSISWDGTKNGTPLPVGTYYYVINPKNGRSIISGNVTIIR